MRISGVSQEALDFGFRKLWFCDFKQRPAKGPHTIRTPEKILLVPELTCGKQHNTLYVLGYDSLLT